MLPSNRPPVVLVLAALAIVHASLTFMAGTWLWALALPRFAPPILTWTLWGLAALSLFAAAARLQAPLWAAVARAFEGRAVAGTIALAGLAAAAVAGLDDRTWFTGDFLLRVGVLDSPVALSRIAPQSMPLDLALHVHLPRAAAAAGWLTQAADGARVLGAIEAALLAALLVAVAKREGRAGAGRLAFALAALGGATLTLMAGFGKAAGEMVLLTAAIATLAHRLARDGRGGLALGAAAALALLFHRSALLLLPALVTAWIVAAREGRLRVGPATGMGAALPLVVLAALGPQLASLLGGFDVPRHLLGSPAGSAPSAWRDPIQWLDRINVALAFAPLAPVLLFPARRPAGREAAARGARAVDFALWIPALALLLFVQPQQGIFRDWDVFVIPGTLIALAAARRVAAWVEGGEDPPRRLAPLAWSAMLSAALWLAVGHDDRAGLARVRAFAAEAPSRPPALTGKLWEFLGDRAAALGRWDDAADALRHAVVTQPSPRLWQMLSMAEMAIGNPGAAEAALAEAAKRDPSVVSTWASWALLALQRGNEAGAHEAAIGLQRIAPGHPLVRRVLGDSAVGAPPR